ncbi:MAG: ferric reductase-like transmembrane domain-containing protein [Candidatus Staskawiczbacteria bacterium]|jgi:predicted ferric reductase
MENKKILSRHSGIPQKAGQNSGLPRFKAGWYILTALSLMPAIIWFFGSSTDLAFGDLSSFSKTMGDLTGLCGMAMFSLVMILSARLKFFEKFFNGINESYTAHHFFGGLSFCLLLFHPLFLSYNYLLVSFQSAALFFLPSLDNWAKNFGSVGLFIMIITLCITFYMRLKYQIWKFTHKFMGIAFIFAFVHMLLIGGDLATNQPLKIYLLVLGVLAIATYFYRTLFADYLVRVFDYKVKNITSYPDKIWEIEFEPKNRILSFVPGQFAFIKLYSRALTKELHPFSFSSAEGDSLKIAIKELGDWTDRVGNLKVGDLAKIEAPFGSFSFKNFRNKKQIWIAGGIGVTPFLSMARSLSEKDLDYKIDLYYSVKDNNCLAFVEELKKISETYKNLKIILWVSAEKGFLNFDSIKTNTPNVEQRDILICGPSSMMSILKKQFLNGGINKKQIHMEEFKLY